MKNKNNKVYEVEKASGLDSKLRKFIQNPNKILSPFIKKDMLVADIGCGTGLYSIEAARLVGEKGKVIAVDIQDGMLEKLKNKINKTQIEKRIIIHKSKKDTLNLKEKFDFIYVLFVVHETPNQEFFYKELKSILKENGKILIAEPSFIVTKKGFEKSINLAQKVGFKVENGPKILLSRTKILMNNEI